MARNAQRVESLALRSANARRRDWLARKAEAEKAGDRVAASEAGRFVAEYEDLIAELERLASDG